MDSEAEQGVSRRRWRCWNLPWSPPEQRRACHQSSRVARAALHPHRSQLAGLKQQITQHCLGPPPPGLRRKQSHEAGVTTVASSARYHVCLLQRWQRKQCRGQAACRGWVMPWQQRPCRGSLRHRRHRRRARLGGPTTHRCVPVSPVKAPTGGMRLSRSLSSCRCAEDTHRFRRCVRSAASHNACATGVMPFFSVGTDAFPVVHAAV